MKELDDLHGEGFISDRFKNQMYEDLIEKERSEIESLKEDIKEIRNENGLDASSFAF